MELKDKKITINCLPPVSIVLFLAFFIAKIFDKIDWSWWWVFSPLWIPTAIILTILAGIGLVYIGAFIVIGILMLYEKWKS